ncbi:hypothetical protein V1517DRAFT_265100 [Lipomyces orientalis]|uniref:Uncharacterized protein n=1 Tax=Lipomyces orientalis TaxID=1233043 RepID=A0ACC3TIY3_9ASCO
MSTGVSSARSTSNNSGLIDRANGSTIFTAGIATAIAGQDSTQDVSQLIHDIWQEESLKEEQSLRQAALASLAAKTAVKTKVATAVSEPTAIATTLTATSATVPAAPTSPTDTSEFTATSTSSSPTLPPTTNSLTLHSSDILASKPATNLSQAMAKKKNKKSQKSSSAIKPPPNSITLTPAVDIPKPSNRGIIDLRKPNCSPELLPHNSSAKAIIDSEVIAAPVDGVETAQKGCVPENNNKSEPGQQTVVTRSPTKAEDLENVTASILTGASPSGRDASQFSAAWQSTAMGTTPLTYSTATSVAPKFATENAAACSAISPTDGAALVVAPPSKSQASAPDVVMVDAPCSPSPVSIPPLGAVGHAREKSSIDIAASALKYALSKFDDVIPADPPAADSDSLIPWLLQSALHAQASLIRMLTEERDQLRLQVRDSKEHADRLVGEVSRLESQIQGMVLKLVERERRRAEKEFLQQLQMDTRDVSTCSSSTSTPLPTFLPLSRQAPPQAPPHALTRALKSPEALSPETAIARKPPMAPATLSEPSAPAALFSAPSQAAEASSQTSRAPPRARQALEQALPTAPEILLGSSQEPSQIQPLLDVPDAVSVKAMPNTMAAIASAVLPQDVSRSPRMEPSQSSLTPVPEPPVAEQATKSLLPVSARSPASASAPAPLSPLATSPVVPSSGAQNGTDQTGLTSLIPKSSAPAPTRAQSHEPRVQAPQTETHPTARQQLNSPTAVHISSPMAPAEPSSGPAATKQQAPKQPASQQPTPKQVTTPPRRIQRSSSPRPARKMSTVPDAERRRQRGPDDVSAHETKRQKTGPQQRTKNYLGSRNIDSYRPNDDRIRERELTGINKSDSQYQLSLDVQRDDVTNLAGRIGGHLQKEPSFNGSSVGGLGDRLGSRISSVGGLGNRIGGASSWNHSQSLGLSNRFGVDATPSSDRRGNGLGHSGDTDFGNRIGGETR